MHDARWYSLKRDCDFGVKGRELPPPEIGEAVEVTTTRGKKTVEVIAEVLSVRKDFWIASVVSNEPQHAQCYRWTGDGYDIVALAYHPNEARALAAELLRAKGLPADTVDAAPTIATKPFALVANKGART